MAATVEQISPIEAELMAQIRVEPQTTLKLKTPVRTRIPITLEREYQKALRDIVRRIKEIIARGMVAALPQLVAQVEQERALFDSSNLNMDATSAELLAKLTVATQASLDRDITKREIELLAETFAQQTVDFNATEMARVFKSVLGVDLVASEPALLAEISNFVQENVNLIDDVGRQFVRTSEQTILSGFRRGLRHEVIAKQILGSVKDPEGFRSRFKKAETRANLIGRDQINKLNGKLSELRQTNAGIKSYIWRTVLDGRVRPDHEAREGQKFRWNAPPFDGHPGEPINCRCFAEPVFKGIV